MRLLTIVGAAWGLTAAAQAAAPADPNGHVDPYAGYQPRVIHAPPLIGGAAKQAAEEPPVRSFTLRADGPSAAPPRVVHNAIDHVTPDRALRGRFTPVKEPQTDPAAAVNPAATAPDQAIRAGYTPRKSAPVPASNASSGYVAPQYFPNASYHHRNHREHNRNPGRRYVSGGYGYSNSHYSHRYRSRVFYYYPSYYSCGGGYIYPGRRNYGYWGCGWTYYSYRPFLFRRGFYGYRGCYGSGLSIGIRF